jgi:hypothetical protein
MGLGGPLFLLNLMNGTPVSVESRGIKTAVVLLCAVFSGFIIIVFASSFQLGKYHAFFFIAVYIGFFSLIVSGVLNDQF